MLAAVRAACQRDAFRIVAKNTCEFPAGIDARDPRNGCGAAHGLALAAKYSSRLRHDGNY
jgi:hypothetical protein